MRYYDEVSQQEPTRFKPSGRREFKAPSLSVLAQLNPPFSRGRGLERKVSLSPRQRASDAWEPRDQTRASWTFLHIDDARRPCYDIRPRVTIRFQVGEFRNPYCYGFMDWLNLLINGTAYTWLILICYTYLINQCDFRWMGKKDSQRVLSSRVCRSGTRYEVVEEEGFIIIAAAAPSFPAALDSASFRAIHFRFFSLFFRQ